MLWSPEVECGVHAHAVQPPPRKEWPKWLLREEAVMIRRAGGSSALRHSHHELHDNAASARSMAFTHDQKSSRGSSSRKIWSSHKSSSTLTPLQVQKGASRKAVVPSLLSSAPPLSPSSSSTSFDSSSVAPSFDHGSSFDSSVRDEVAAAAAAIDAPAPPARIRRIGVPGGESIDYKSRAALMRWYGSSFRAAYNSQIFEVATALLILRFVYLLIQNRNKTEDDLMYDGPKTDDGMASADDSLQIDDGGSEDAFNIIKFRQRVEQLTYVKIANSQITLPT